MATSVQDIFNTSTGQALALVMLVPPSNSVSFSDMSSGFSTNSGGMFVTDNPPAIAMSDFMDHVGL